MNPHEEITYHQLPGAQWTQLPTEEATQRYDLLKATHGVGAGGLVVHRSNRPAGREACSRPSTVDCRPRLRRWMVGTSTSVAAEPR